jgi:hypothetical protein
MSRHVVLCRPTDESNKAIHATFRQKLYHANDYCRRRRIGGEYRFELVKNSLLGVNVPSFINEDL